MRRNLLLSRVSQGESSSRSCKDLEVGDLRSSTRTHSHFLGQSIEVDHDLFFGMFDAGGQEGVGADGCLGRHGGGWGWDLGGSRIQARVQIKGTVEMCC